MAENVADLTITILREIQATLAADRARTTRRFDEMSQRFNSLDLRFNALDARLGDLKLDVQDIIDAALGGMQSNLNARMDTLERQMAELQASGSDSAG